MATAQTFIQCQWCTTQSPLGTLSCPSCGAPLDSRNVVSDSGWTAAPRIRDMTRIEFGTSTCQVEGHMVPVADLQLGAGDAVFFEHHVMLWKDDSVPLENLSLSGGITRLFAGMPFSISMAKGPGHIAFSRDASGELVVLPMHPGMEMDVREHAFVLASHSLDYSFVRVKGLANMFFGGEGMFMDRFVTRSARGLLMLHGYGNVFQRMLKPGESILIEPGGFLYKDSSVAMDVEFQKIGGSFLGGKAMALARVRGPGRVGIQSMYHHHHQDRK